MKNNFNWFYKILANLIVGLFFSAVTFANSEHCRLTFGINVSTPNRILSICENGIVVKEFNVALGRKGVEKKRDGDKKTPLGLYELAAPRKSRRFNIFIPIHYPTQQQLALGYSGKDVGIHGPFLLFAWLGSLNTIFNWTEGCIALSKNEQIEFIANWVNSHPQTKILIY